MQKSHEALEQAAQKSGSATIPVCVQETGICDTQGHGLIGIVVMGSQLDQMILKAISNLNDSKISNMGYKGSYEGNSAVNTYSCIIYKMLSTFDANVNMNPKLRQFPKITLKVQEKMS